MKLNRKRPAVIFDGNKPTGVILDIAAYKRLVEMAEDREDLRYLATLRRRPLDVQSLEDYLQERRNR